MPDPTADPGINSFYGPRPPRRKVIVVTYTWTSEADQAQSDLDAVLAGHLSPYDFATTTVDSQIEDLADEEDGAEVVWLFGEGGAYADDPEGEPA